MFGEPKYLKFDLEVMSQSEQKLRDAVSELTTIQENLQKAIDDLITAKGWDSGGSKAFKENYDTSWVEGIDDRKAVMERMCEHLVFAQQTYEPIETEAEDLKLETN